jgi:hypothetical protein
MSIQPQSGEMFIVCGAQETTGSSVGARCVPPPKNGLKKIQIVTEVYKNFEPNGTEDNTNLRG